MIPVSASRPAVAAGCPASEVDIPRSVCHVPCRRVCPRGVRPVARSLRRVRVRAPEPRTHPGPSMIHEASRGHGHFRRLAGLGEEGCCVGSPTIALDARRSSPRTGCRSVVVVTDDGELAVAVRDTVPPGIALVRDARPDDAAEIAAACLPWPWMVVGSTDSLTSRLAMLLRDASGAELWLGSTAGGSARRTCVVSTARRRCSRPSAARALRTSAACASLREAAWSCTMAALLRGATLEALVGRVSPRGVAVIRSVSHVSAAARHAPAWRTRSVMASSCIALVRCRVTACAR